MLDITFAQRARFKPAAKTARGALVIPVPEQGKMPDWLEAIDKDCYGKIKKVMASTRFEAKKKQMMTLLAPEGLQYDLLILVGVGKGKELGTVCYESLGGVVTAELNKHGVKQAAVVFNDIRGSKVSETDAAMHFGLGLQMKSYRFDKYRTKLKESDKPSLEAVSLFVDDAPAAKKCYEEEIAVLGGTFMARDLVNEPGNILHPESYAELVQKELGGMKNLKIEVLGEKEMEKLGCGSLLSVGEGSVRESKMVILHYTGGGKKDKPLAFIGKGVTFDTGGISIKPSNGMEDMKMDMGGSAAVVGLLKALAAREAKVNVVGVIGLVENMPDGKAQRPGDIRVSMSGQTIEVQNTDAEGRLVLADCLWYAQDKFKPQFMVDLATLTGAILVALGETTAGLFSNNDKLAERLAEAGKKTGEKLWRLPMGPEYDALLDSPIADMQNISSGRWGGSITAAQFLQRFVNDVPWAHLDIAGTATASKANDLGPKGGSGFGVRLLNEFVKENYEK